MDTYAITNSVLDSDVANTLQADMLATKVDNNSSMTESTSERKNKTLNSTYFTSNSRTIVNAINKTYKSTLDASEKANEAVSLVKNTIGDTESESVNTALSNLKEKTEKSNLIEIVNEIYENGSGSSSSDFEEEIIDFSSWE